jgi:hypothetical protein
MMIDSITAIIVAPSARKSLGSTRNYTLLLSRKAVATLSAAAAIKDRSIHSGLNNLNTIYTNLRLKSQDLAVKTQDSEVKTHFQLTYVN